jgi:hypothetical protein
MWNKFLLNIAEARFYPFSLLSFNNFRRPIGAKKDR